MRFSIAARISLGFGLFAAAVFVVYLLNRSAVVRSKTLHNRIASTLLPEIAKLNQMQEHVQHVYTLTLSWSAQQRSADNPERKWLESLCKDSIPNLIHIIDSSSCSWNELMTRQWAGLEPEIQQFLILSETVRKILPDFDSYSDPTNQINAESICAPGAELQTTFNNALSKLQILLIESERELKREVISLNQSLDYQSMVMTYLLITLILGAIIMGAITIRSIVYPIQSLRNKLINLSRGVYSLHKTKAGNDEIGDMAKAVDVLINNFERTKEFTLQIGEGNFTHYYEPLSKQDEMGQSLLSMRDELRSYRNEMEHKVKEQTIEISRQKDEVDEQRLQVLNLYNDLQSSIDYALKIQQTILPTDQYLKECFPESFVLYKPKATVSGDFYWCSMKGSKRMLAAADCTGHGVPGAFMSLVGYNAFNQAVKVFLKPSQVMNSVNRFSIKAMRAEGVDQGLKDGMDVAFICFDMESKELLFAAAKNPGFLARKGEILTLDADPFSVGAHYSGEKEFSQQSIQIENGDTLYLFSDGYADQFGGPDGKKFMRRRFKEMLLTASKMELTEQHHYIENQFETWRGSLEQIDDVMVIGIKF